MFGSDLYINQGQTHTIEGLGIRMDVSNIYGKSLCLDQ